MITNRRRDIRALALTGNTSSYEGTGTRAARSSKRVRERGIVAPAAELTALCIFGRVS